MAVTVSLGRRSRCCIDGGTRPGGRVAGSDWPILAMSMRYIATQNSSAARLPSTSMSARHLHQQYHQHQQLKHHHQCDHLSRNARDCPGMPGTVPEWWAVFCIPGRIIPGLLYVPEWRSSTGRHSDNQQNYVQTPQKNIVFTSHLESPRSCGEW